MRHPRRGMTLLEILVVVGIIAVLFALITNVVAGVRNSAKAVSCANNERSIYASMITFAADHDGYLPVPAQCSTVDMPNTNGPNVAWAMDINHPEGGSVDFNVGTLWSYMSPSVAGRQLTVKCPADTSATSTYGGVLNPDRNFSYSFNANITHPSGQVSMKLTRVVKPALKILIYEENAPNDEWNVSGNGTNGDDLPSGRHGTTSTDVGGVSNHIWYTMGQGNYCFFDGHVETLTPAQIITDESQNPNNCRWFPLTQ